MISLKNYAITFCAALAIFGVLAMFLMPLAAKSFNEPSSREQTEQGEETGEGDKTVGGSSEGVDVSSVKGNSFTLLLLGVDYLPESLSDYDSVFDSSVVQNGEKTVSVTEDGEIPESALTYAKKRKTTCDAILLLQYNKEKQTVLTVSVPSNTRVMVDGNNMTLGRVLPMKGITFFREKIQALTGLAVDYYMLVTPKLFINVIDTLGGVTYDVPQDMNYEDPVEKYQISLKAGKQLLDGEKALSLLRYVGYADGDAGRMKTARSFIASMLSQLYTYNGAKGITKLFTDVLPYIYSDLNSDIFAAGQDLLFCYDDFTKAELTYPGQQVTLGGVSYYEPDVASATETYREYRLTN